MPTTRTPANSVFHRLDRTTSQNLKEINAKLTILTTRVANLQAEVATLTSAIAAANVLWVKILDSPESRLDAAAELARERHGSREKGGMK